MRFKNYFIICITILFFHCAIFLKGVLAITSTATAVGGGTWATAVWSNGVPTGTADAVINSGINLTINTAAVCGSLTLGNILSKATTLTLSGGGSLNINGTSGDFIINPLNVKKAFSVSINTHMLSIAGSILYPTSGATSISISTGSFSVGGQMALGTKDIFTFTGAGTANFKGGLSDGAGSLTTFSGCVVYMGGNYTVTNKSVIWAVGSTCVFTANSTVTPTSSITFEDIHISAGTVFLAGNIIVNGNWVNNGGGVLGAAPTITFNGQGKTISGTTSTLFPSLILASSAVYTISNNNSCTSLTFESSSSPSSLTQSGSASFDVIGDVVVNNPKGNATSSWNINAGSSIVSGNVTIGNGGGNSFRIANIIVSSGELTVLGNLSYNIGNSASGVLDISGGASTVNLAGDFTLLSGFGTLIPGSLSVFNYNGSLNGQVVTLNSSISYNNLRLNNTSAAGAVINTAITTSNVTGNLSIQSGKLSNAGFTITGNLSKLFSVANNSTFQIESTIGMVTGFGSKVFGSTSTVYYSGATQDISSETYGHLVLDGSLIKTALGVISVNGDFIVDGTTQFNAGVSLSHTFKGNLVFNTTNVIPFSFTTSSVVNINSPISPAITSLSGSATSGVSFNNVNINNTSGFNINHDFSVSANLTIASSVTVTPGFSNIISGTGTLLGLGTIKVTRTSSPADFLSQYPITNRILLNLTVDYNASAPQIVSPVEYGDLKISSNGTRLITLAPTGTISISNDFSPSLTNTTYSVTGSTINFNGSSAQAIDTAFTFFNLSLNNSNGLSLGASIDLINVLAITSGTFSSVGYNCTLKSSVVGTASIAPILSGANFSGNIIMERFTGSGPTDWRFLSSAVTASTIGDWSDDFATSGFIGATCGPSDCLSPGCSATCNWPSIYSYNESTAGVRDSGFVAATNVTNSISGGNGFWVYLGPTSVVFETKGAPNMFSKSPTISFTSSSGIDEDGWNMVANPYPSAIDWDNLNWTKTNVDDALYIYNSSTGSYASYVAGIGVNGGSNYIPSQQSFWVKANASSPSITMIEDIKSAADPSFLRDASSSNTSFYPMAFNDFQVQLNTNSLPNTLKLTARGNGYDDEMIVRFVNGASISFDSSFDAWKMNNLNGITPNISSVINDTNDLSINCFSELNSNVSIPIRVTVPASGVYTIIRDSILMLPMSSCIFLEDLWNGNIADLRLVMSYSFTISDTTKAPRFMLHIYKPITTTSVGTYCPYDSTGIAVAMGTGSGPWSYTWKDELGNILKTSSNISSADTIFNLISGIYYVDVSGNICGNLTDTVVVNSFSNITSTPSQANISCYGMNDGHAEIIAPGGGVPYLYLWNTGSTGSMISNLSSGTYSVIVTDSVNCFQSHTYYISEPQKVNAAFLSSKDTAVLSSTDTVYFYNNSSGSVNYSWDFGDNSPLEYSKDSKHVYYSMGTYTVMLSSSYNSCIDTMTKIVEVVNSVSGILDVSNQNLVNTYYNNENIYLSFNLPESLDISIGVYNMLGEKILFSHLGKLKKDESKVFSFHSVRGIYVLVVDTKYGRVSKKIIIN